jgi:hypothetical protein
MNKDNIPVFKITIDDIYAEDGEDLGYNKIAHTFKPAIKLKGAAFSAQVKKLFFADDVKMRIAAPLMIPSKIYRYDEDTEDEYYVEFTAEVIEQMYKKFMLNLENQEMSEDEKEEMSEDEKEEEMESDEKEEELESDEEKEEFEALTMEQVLEAMAPIHEDLINRIAELEAKIELANEEEVEEEKTVMKTNLSEILKKASKFTNIR